MSSEVLPDQNQNTPHPSRRHTDRIEISERPIEKLSPNELFVLALAQDVLLEDAKRDKQTGVYNKDAFMEDFELMVERAHEHNEPVLLMFADGDKTKFINDTSGHATGDTMIKTLAEVLKDSVRDYDKVYRLGGDEFAAILPGFDPTEVNNEDTIKELQERVERLANQRLKEQGINGGGMSLGVALLKPGESAREFFERADNNMYARKYDKGDARKVGPDDLSPSKQQILEKL